MGRSAETIDLTFGMWTRVGRRKHKFNRIRQVAPMCPYERAHWSHLANTIEQSVWCGDAAICQITLTTCYYYYSQPALIDICASLAAWLCCLISVSYCWFLLKRINAVSQSVTVSQTHTHRTESTTRITKVVINNTLYNSVYAIRKSLEGLWPSLAGLWPSGS